MLRIAFFDSKPYDIASFNNINTKYEITYYTDKLSIDNVILCNGFDAVCIFVNDDVTKDVIDKLVSYNIKVLLLRCAGFNNVELSYTYKKIHVLRVPSYSPNAIAEYTFALFLSLNRKIHKSYNRTRDLNFNINGLTGFNLYGKTIGVIGTGKIGKAVINIAIGFNMNVLGYDIYPDNTLNIKYVDLITLYQNSDIISLHLPLSSDNYHMINKDAINLMKDGVMIINTSRGALIDSAALLNGLRTKKIGGAALDVYEEEHDLFFNDLSNEIINDDIIQLLLSLPNVIITSHQAYLTNEALTEIAKTTLDNMDAYTNKKFMINEVCYKCNKNPKECYNKRKKNCW